MDDPGTPAGLTHAEVATAVRRQKGLERCTVTEWKCQRLTAGSSNALGVWRLTGNAQLDSTVQPWSMILKGWAAPEPGTSSSSFTWPHREMEMYRSGLLGDLPGGIHAPICLGDMERFDGSVWIWLEDIAAKTDGPWLLERYGIVARHLGQFNGAYLTERQLPTHHSLSRGWLRQRVEAVASTISALEQRPNDPLVEQVYPGHVITTYKRMWDKREAYYASLDQLPQSFCHLDAFRRNVFIRGTPDGNEEVILIDWAYAGMAAVVEELTSLIVASVSFMEVPFDNAQQLQNLVLDSYIAGLQDAGWHGNPDGLRTGFGIAAALRYGVGALNLWVPIVHHEQYQRFVEQIIGRPFDEISRNMAAVHTWLADLTPDG